MPKYFNGSKHIYIPYKYKKHNLHDRIFKREIIISCLLGNGELLSNEPFNIAKPTLKIVESNYEYALFKYNLLKQINWTSKITIRKSKQYNLYMLSCPYDKKFRIYYKWLYKGKERIKTTENIIQYMFTEYFPAIIVMDRGRLNSNGELEIHIPVGNLQTQREMDKLFEYIYDIQSYSSIDMIKFNKTNTKKLLDLIEPIIIKVPSKFAYFYSTRQQQAEDIV